MRRLTVLYAEDVITAEAIEAELMEPRSGAEERSAGEAENLSSSVDRHLARYFSAHKDGLPAAGLYDRILREVERPLIIRTLAATNGNQIKAARVLGLNRNTLRKKIRVLVIQVVRGAK